MGGGITMIYARQIPPEYQESPLYFNDLCFPQDIAVFGNRDFNEHIPGFFEDIKNELDNATLADDLDSIDVKNNGGSSQYCYYKSYRECINDCIPPHNRDPYTDNEIQTLRKLINDYQYAPQGSNTEKEMLCKIISIVTGQTWDYTCIRGCVQSDWNYIYYPDTWTDDMVKRFEVEYFNMGTEWEVHCVDDTESEIPNDPEEIQGYWCYCHSCDDQEIKKEICEIDGRESDPEMVVLYAFDGYIKTPKYRRM